MHEVIVVSLKGRLKVFVNGEQTLLFGERGAVPDEDKTWQRLFDNINVSPKEISFLLLRDRTDGVLLTRIEKFLSQVNTLQILDLNYETACLGALHGKDSFTFCGCVARLEEQVWHCEFIDNESVANLPTLSFAEVFSFLPAIRAAKKEIGSLQRDLTRVQNQLKSFRKKFKK